MKILKERSMSFSVFKVIKGLSLESLASNTVGNLEKTVFFITQMHPVRFRQRIKTYML